MKKTFKHLKKQRILENKESAVKENVLVVNDGELFKVNKVIDIHKKLINALLKKAKEATGKDPKIFWNDLSVADEIVKYLIDNYLNIDSLPASILIGDTNLEAEEVVIETPAVEEPKEKEVPEKTTEEPTEEAPKVEEPAEKEKEEEKIPELETEEEKEEAEESDDEESEETED